MELLVVATSMLRLFLVSVVYLLNIRGLLRLTWQPRACIHALTTGAVLLAGVLYLSSWAPYIAYTLANGHWLLLGARRHCLLQHFVAAEIGAVLLALLAVRLMYRLLVRVYKRPLPSARAASLVTCMAWLGPQLLYDAVAVTRDDTTRSPDSYRFLDDLLVVPQGSNASHGYRVGFMICMQLLSGPVLSYYVWQYLVLVLPLAGVIIYCSARLMLASHIRRREEPSDSSVESRSGRFAFLNWSKRAVCQYGCKTNTFVDMALYYNFIWLVVLRPLAILHALYMQTGEWGNAFYMDFGSHLVLAFSAVFSPFSVGNPNTPTPPEPNRLTETINPIIMQKKHDKDSGLLTSVVPDVCPQAGNLCLGSGFASSTMKKVESYENISDLKGISKDCSVALENKEKPGEESVC
ncbi:uncharacterized protein CEXT_402821 [Caerostris extrusa]|uniref:G-protein coupled receptors family 1 profile domain-containing protein n=1 Tax=Caerostris extrusa TaxID=172846 RepID=A0AAV4PR70_CAEEX|nr:uncharacterized protein CEXT_402821 [Caerostris extrusa]